jgi:hypothetical protein
MLSVDQKVERIVTAKGVVDVDRVSSFLDTTMVHRAAFSCLIRFSIQTSFSRVSNMSTHFHLFTFSFDLHSVFQYVAFSRCRRVFVPGAGAFPRLPRQESSFTHFNPRRGGPIAQSGSTLTIAAASSTARYSHPVRLSTANILNSDIEEQ